MIPLQDRLHSLRKQAKLSLRDLAEQSGVSISYLSEIERGAIPNLDILERIADVYNLSVGEILVDVRIRERNDDAE